MESTTNGTCRIITELEEAGRIATIHTDVDFGTMQKLVESLIVPEREPEKRDDGIHSPGEDGISRKSYSETLLGARASHHGYWILCRGRGSQFRDVG